MIRPVDFTVHFPPIITKNAFLFLLNDQPVTAFIIMCHTQPRVNHASSGLKFLSFPRSERILRMLMSNSIKEDNRHSMYTDYRTEMHLHNSVRDNMKEYYI